MTKQLAVIFFSVVLTACWSDSGSDYTPESGADAAGHTPATEATAAANAKFGSHLPFEDDSDFENAKRGLIDSDESLVIRNPAGQTIWNQDRFDFLRSDAPPSVNPSLWRQAKLNAIHGLFKVTERIYQIRGYDLANMSIIEGDTGLIIVDPLTTQQNAEAAMRMVRKHLGDKPITAIIYTHSHIDHFGGVDGVISVADAKANKVRIIAPAGFAEEATSENVMAGVAMQRRASYQYGRRLARSERGHVDLGLGKEVPFGGSIGYLAPTEIVDKTGTELNIDGVRFQFQYTPESEAPAEFTFYLPDFKAFCGAEVVSRTLHNVYTLRGAKVRNALRWSNYIDEMIELFGDAEIYYASHHWPLWGNAEIITFLENQRDSYKYIHDQTLRMANNGMTSREIAEEITLPKALQNTFANRDYYGTVKHNAKAVYQFYFGWYDGNPANLDSLPPAAAGEKYVAALGGADALLEQAQTAFDNGEYRWGAELLNHLVFAEPKNEAARSLLAKTYDQLGYQAESGPWRSVYLSAAYELRHGGPDEGVDLKDAKAMLAEIPVELFFDSMAGRLNGPKAEGEELRVNFVFTDLGVGRHLLLKHSVLHHDEYIGQAADTTLNLTHELFLKMITKEAGIKDTLFSDDLSIDGSRLDLIKFMGLFDQPEGKFAIVTP